MCLATLICIKTITLMVLAHTFADQTVINTSSGRLKGKFVKKFDAQYYSYQGIPYAESPTGTLRFQPPVPKSSWTGIRDATTEGFACPQANVYKREQMSEDCLNLNIYVPVSDLNTILPVIVYIHGGDFKSRSSRADDIEGPHFLVRKNIVVVTVNYRLSALGFLSLEMEGALGNAGLKDVLLALKWIKQNIEQFGGDPNRITLAGNSAGAAITHILMLTPKATSLFNQTLLISGSALNFRYIARTPKANALMLAKQLGIQAIDSETILKELQNIDAFDLIKSQEDMGKNYKRKGFITFTPFAPSIEIEHTDAILTREPREIVKSGIPQNVPVLAQMNTDEGLKLLPAISNNHTLVAYLNENFELCIPSDILYPYGSRRSKHLAKSFRDFYFDGGDISNCTIQDYIDFVTDATFTYVIDSWIRIHKQRTDSNKVYLYRFGFDGELNWFKTENNFNYPGTAHADELGYLFVTNATKPKLLEAVDHRTRRMVDVMTTIITNFVKYGNPTPTKEDIGVIFEETNKNRHHLLIGNCSISYVQEPPTPKRLQFWYNTYDQYYQYLNNGGEIQYKDYSDVEFES